MVEAPNEASEGKGKMVSKCEQLIVQLQLQVKLHVCKRGHRKNKLRFVRISDAAQLVLALTERVTWEEGAVSAFLFSSSPAACQTLSRWNLQPKAVSVAMFSACSRGIFAKLNGRCLPLKI